MCLKYKFVFQFCTPSANLQEVISLNEESVLGKGLKKVPERMTIKAVGQTAIGLLGLTHDGILFKVMLDGSLSTLESTLCFSDLVVSYDGFYALALSTNNVLCQFDLRHAIDVNMENCTKTTLNDGDVLNIAVGAGHL